VDIRVGDDFSCCCDQRVPISVGSVLNDYDAVGVDCFVSCILNSPYMLFYVSRGHD
jgi:hypothetical protein